MRILRFIPLLLLSLVLTTGCNVKKGVQVVDQRQVDTLAHSLLWKIEKDGLDAPSYLFGTIHIIPAEDFFWPNGTLSAFDESQQVAFEIDMNIMSDMSAIMRVRDQMFMPGDTTLRMLYSEEDYKKINDYFNAQGVPLMFMERIKPLFLSAMVGVDGAGQNFMENDRIKSYEMELQKMVDNSRNKDGSSKAVMGLETVEMQLSKIDKIPLAAQAEMLLSAIIVEEEGGGQFDGLVEIYRSQNINAMIAEVEEAEDMGEFSSVLLDDRNQSWIPVIDSLVHDKPTFIAVGAAHLGGDQGVIRLLQRAGYTLTPLSAKEN